MTSRGEILAELVEIGSELGKMPQTSPYQAPEGYFDELPALVMMRIKTQHVQTAEEETAIVSPFLASLKKESPFSVPEGYFEKLTASIPVVQERKPARVVAFRSDKFFKFAAAAVTIGLISLLAWILLKSPDASNQYALKQDPSVDKQVQQKIEGMTDIDITAYLDVNELTTMEARDIQETDDDVTLMLADVSDQELENYAAMHGSVKEKFN